MNRHLLSIWFLTLVLGPFVYGIINLIREVEGQVVTLLEVMPITLLFSFVFSLPTLLIAFLVNRFLIHGTVPINYQKLTNLLIGATGITITLLIIEGSLMPTLIMTYLISIFLSAVIVDVYDRSYIQDKKKLESYSTSKNIHHEIQTKETNKQSNNE